MGRCYEPTHSAATVWQMEKALWEARKHTVQGTVRSTVRTVEPWNQCLGKKVHGFPGTKGAVEPGNGSRGSRVPLIGYYVYKTKDIPF